MVQVEPLRIRVRSREGAPGPAPALPDGAGPLAAPSRSVHPAAGPDALRGRVREALRCPYCREDVAPEAEGAAEASPSLSRSARREVAVLVALAAVAGVAAVQLIQAQLDVAAAIAGAAALTLLGDAVLKPVVEALRRELLRLRGSGDAAAGEATLACARRGCGALYHTECWEECRASYGACAVFACGSTEAAGVSGVGLALRLIRMFVAAWVFTPQMVDVLRDREDAGLAAIRESIRGRAARTHEQLWSTRGEQERTTANAAFSLLQIAVVGISVVASITFTFWGLNARVFARPMVPVVLFAIPALAVLGLYGASWAGALFIYGAKAILAGELAALGRIGRAGSYLSRIKPSGGKK